MNVGERIRQARREQKMSQKDLAKKLNITFNMISQYERGLRNPKYETAQKIATALDVDVNWLVHGKTLEERDAAIMAKFDVLFEDVELQKNATKNITEKTKLLNTRGRVRLSEYADDLCQIPKYCPSKKEKE